MYIATVTAADGQLSLAVVAVRGWRAAGSMRRNLLLPSIELILLTVVTTNSSNLQ